MKPEIPLCVDMDGTLLKTDTLFETFFLLIRHDFLAIILVPLWLLKGKAHLKENIAKRVSLDPSLIPYQEQFLEFLRIEYDNGRKLILVTAANYRIADAVAGYLGIFSEVVASDSSVNMSGTEKSKRLLAQFGERGFDYAGNARADLKIWSHAKTVILVNPEYGVMDSAKRLDKESVLFDDDAFSLQTYFYAMRLHQWVKNVLVFVPLLVSHSWGDIELLTQSMLGFLAFGLCASSVYLLNDLLDLSNDRVHPTKRNRPLASGALKIQHGMLLIPILLALALAVSILLPPEFFLVLGIYYATTLAYSFRLKRTVLVDVLVLAGLYTLRIIAGAATISVIPSFWLLAFSMFLFLSLAMVKRYCELSDLRERGKVNAKGRGYQVIDMETLISFGSSAGYLAVLVLALYINSEAVMTMYKHPEVVWMLCPIFLYWISRIWLIARRGAMHEDPVIFAVRDRPSQIMGVMMALFLWFAI